MVGSSGFYEENSGGQAPDTALMSSVVAGLGGVDPNKKPIEYKPRSPLAMPPSTSDLPPPEAEGTAEANTGQWPVSPEELDAERRKKGTLAEMKRLENMEKSQRLSKEELEAGRIPGQRENRVLTYEERRDEDNAVPRRLSRAEMSGLRVNTPETIEYKPGEVPERRYLIEPPTKYREPSPEAAVAEPEDKGLNSWIPDMF